MDDILARVRNLSAACGYHGSKEVLDGAAAEIARLTAERDRLLTENEALRAQLDHVLIESRLPPDA